MILFVCRLVAQSKDFKDVEIDDDLLGNILEYPTKAFEIRTDRDKKKLRVKPTFTAQNLRDWDDETDLKLKGKLQPNMKKEKFPSKPKNLINIKYIPKRLINRNKVN